MAGGHEGTDARIIEIAQNRRKQPWTISESPSAPIANRGILSDSRTGHPLGGILRIGTTFATDTPLWWGKKIYRKYFLESL